MERLTGTHVLLTGGTGFVGSHVAHALVKQQATVIIPYRSLDPRSFFSTQNIAKQTVLVSCDLKDKERVLDIVTKYEIDTIIHLGAQPIVTTAYVNPAETLATNILGTTHVLEAARVSPSVKKIIIASSDKAYGKSNKPYTEDMPLAGDHPYEVSKSATDMIAQMYIKTYGLPIVITRFGNIYGPGDLNFSRIIPGIMKALLLKEKLHIRSDGTFIRDYVYVGDVVSAYLYILQHFDQTKGEAYNIASYDSMSVLDVVKKSQKILKKVISYSVDNTAVNEIPSQHLVWEKISKTGWTPKYRISKGLQDTFLWYKKNKHLLW